MPEAGVRRYEIPHPLLLFLFNTTVYYVIHTETTYDYLNQNCLTEASTRILGFRIVSSTRLRVKRKLRHVLTGAHETLHLSFS